MKKVLLSALIAVTSLGLSSNASALSIINDGTNSVCGFSSNEANLTIKITITITWATSSISSVDVDPSALSDITKDPTTGEKTMSVHMSEIPPAKMPLFGGSVFHFTTDCPLSNNVCMALGIPVGSVIPAGDYTLSRVGDFFVMQVSTT